MAVSTSLQLGCVWLLALIAFTAVSHTGLATADPVVLSSFTFVTGDPQDTVREFSPTAMPEVECRWTEGSPKSPVVILGPDKQEVARSRDFPKRDSFLRRRLGLLGCADTGDYRCVVEGTGQVMALTVLVACPLQFLDPPAPTVPVMAGDDAQIRFDVFSYTTDLADCYLKGPNPGRNDPRQSYFPCNSSGSELKVEGSPPRLRLTVRPKSVTSQDDGRWEMEAGNGKEICRLPNVSFHLNVNASLLGPPEDDSEAFCSWIIVGTGASSAVVVIAVVAVVVWMCRRRRVLPRGRSAESHSARPAQQEVPNRINDEPDYEEPRCLGTHTAPAENYVDAKSLPVSLAPGGPYEQLQMNDVGVESIYSEIDDRGDDTAI